MLWVLKRTVSMRLFFWVPTTYVLVEVVTVIPPISPIKDHNVVLIFLPINSYMCFRWIGAQKNNLIKISFEYPQHIFWLRNKIFLFSYLEACLWSASQTWSMAFILNTGFRSVVKKGIWFLECSWNHEYFGSLAKLMWIWASLTLQETRSIHDSMNIPKI